MLSPITRTPAKAQISLESRRRGSAALSAATLLLGMFLAGCSKPSETAIHLTPEQVPGALRAAFKGSDETRQDTAAAVTAVEGKRPDEALDSLRRLTTRTDLSPDQRRVASAAVRSVIEQLQAEASSGSKKAKDALEEYQATK